ncbi:MAG: efflux RND transporter periplasmic adaptor subunit [Candidatus Marinimicrobia bacterium]|nr:efflux RND transporter periplasmic adaptor subunit [Candidatus Neomarinimicrobiota bacterium]MDP6966465.1 efflux RND transporter periplasmic adaptor subunit [Candidatus Neomarinimicrobiota bacterium]
MSQEPAVQDHNEAAAVEWWTCSMHPDVKLPEPGQCPICFMDLIPVTSSLMGGGPRQLKMSESAVALAEVQTVPVRRGVAHVEVRLSGKVEYDETRLANITSWVPGRLERLFVDYTGITVRKGDHLVELYSPELFSAQEELLQARRHARGQEGGVAARTSHTVLEATKEKLRLLGLTVDQIKEIEERGTASDRVTIYSPQSGVVIHKNAVEGMYVSTGSKIYTIADLSRVWVVLDAYESDLNRLGYGQEVTMSVEALPGEIFIGRIAFIEPVLNEKTRTVKVRVNMPNTDGKLKPGMFVRAVVASSLDVHGHAINSDLAGKWVCPMHPEVVKEQAGRCDVCGMNLVKAEEMGIVNVSDAHDQSLLVPASAVLLTGKRAIVYVKVASTEEPAFEGREVVLGPRAGDEYVVLKGLHEGEEVVVKGNFKIDSAMQISAKPSMMSPEGGAAPKHDHGGGGDHE